jgi:hypothetical protein
MTSSTASQSASLGKPHLQEIETLEEDDHIGSDWLGEYQRGCDWEIYTTKLSETFEGTPFHILVEMLFHKLGIVLFGLEIEDIRKEKPTKKVYLNPADFIIPSQSDFKILAFVIARNKAQADLTFSKVTGDHESIFQAAGLNFHHLSLLGVAHLRHQASQNQQHDDEGIHRRDSFEERLQAKINNKNRSRTESGNEMEVASSPSSPDTSPKSKERKRISFKKKLGWQLLLRKHESEKTTETVQEELQKQEDKFLQENYFIRSTQKHFLDLSDVYVNTSVHEELPFLENHIIIIGKSLSNLYDLIRPLRAKSLGILKHIVILYPGDFPIRLWQRISVFESIWIVRGSLLEEADLRRCGIFKAKQIVLLASASSGSGGGASTGKTTAKFGKTDTGLDALDDVDAIFCYQAIKRMNESAHIIVEIVRHNNVGYLDPESGLNSSEVDYKFTPQFASGTLFTTSMLDTVVCQSFYNTKIIEILNKLIGGQLLSSSNTSQQQQQSASYTERTNNNNSNGKSRVDQTQKGLLNSSLYQIPLPEKLESKTYGALFSLLVKRKQIPLGLLRGIFSNTKSGPKNNTTPYVYTNPPKDTELFSCDKVFVLSQTPVKITRVNKVLLFLLLCLEYYPNSFLSFPSFFVLLGRKS